MPEKSGRSITMAPHAGQVSPSASLRGAGGGGAETDADLTVCAVAGTRAEASEATAASSEPEVLRAKKAAE